MYNNVRSKTPSSGILGSTPSNGILGKRQNKFDPNKFNGTKIFRADTGVFQDTAMTTATTTTGQDVNAWQDTTGTINFATLAGTAPTYLTDVFGSGGRKLESGMAGDQMFIIRTPPASIYKPTTFTYGLWIKPTASDDSGTVFGIWNDSGTKIYGIKIIKDGADYFFEFHITDNGLGTGANEKSVRYATAIEFGNWYFVAVSSKNTTDADSIGITVTKKGDAYNNKTTSTGFVLYVSPNIKMLYLGAAVSTNDYNGSVAAAFFYGSELSNAQLSALYNSGTALYYNDLTDGQKTGLVAYWNLNEKSTGIVLNSHNDIPINKLTDTLTDPEAYLTVKECAHFTWGFWNLTAAPGPNDTGFPAIRFVAANTHQFTCDALGSLFNANYPEWTIGMVLQNRGATSPNGMIFSAGKTGVTNTSVYWSSGNHLYTRDSSGRVYDQPIWAGTTNANIALTNGWDNPLDNDSGFAVTAVSSTTLTDSTKTFTVDALIGTYVYIVAGAGASADGTQRKFLITDNDATTITVDSWTEPLSAGANKTYYSLNDPATHISGGNNSCQNAFVFGTQSTPTDYGHELKIDDPNFDLLEDTSIYPILSKSTSKSTLTALNVSCDEFALGAWMRGNHVFMAGNYNTMDIAMLIIIPQYLTSRQKIQLRNWMQKEVGIT